jgi:hypothetical protein
LIRKGLITTQEASGVFDACLLNLETHQAIAGPDMQPAFEMARAAYEDAIAQIASQR